MRRLLVLLLALGGCSEAGTPGRDGTDGAYAEAKIACGAVDPESGLFFTYEVVDFSNGDVFVSCSVSDTYVEASDSDFYLAGQNGAANGGCGVTMDPAGDATGGWWNFTISGSDVTAVYDDPGDANDGYTLTFLASECTFVER